MAGECRNDLQLDHSERLSKLEAKTDVLSEIFKLTKDLHITLIQIASDNGKMLTAIETQGSALEKQGRVQEKMLAEMDNMREMMANKDSLARVHTKIEELEKGITSEVDSVKEEIDVIKNKPAQDALEREIAREKALKDAFGKLALQVIGALAVAVALLYFGLK